jgi:mannose/fructose/N-acetylgalactosamine-specific phosphotransferase system component IIC
MTAPDNAARRGPTDPTRRTALVAGILYLVTFLSSIPAVFLLGPVLTDPHYVTGAGADAQVSLGALLDLVNALACIGTAVALYSVVRRQHEGLALGFVTTRMFEAAVIAIGVVSILAVVTLRQTGAADARPPRWSRAARRSSPSATGRSCSGREWPDSTRSCSAP